MIPAFSPKDIEYMATYPNGRPDEKVLLMVVIEGKERWLIYAPRIIHYSSNFERNLLAREIYDGHGRKLAEYSSAREMILNNELYVLPDKETFFTIIPLDKPKKPIVKKEEVEKLFGCQIDG